MCGAQEAQKKVSDSLEVNLQTVVSRHVDAGNWIQVFTKSNKRSFLTLIHPHLLGKKKSPTCKICFNKTVLFDIQEHAIPAEYRMYNVC